MVVMLMALVLLILWPASYRWDMKKDWTLSDRHAVGVRVFEGRLTVARWSLTRQRDWLAFSSDLYGIPLHCGFGYTAEAFAERNRKATQPQLEDSVELRWQLLDISVRPRRDGVFAWETPRSNPQQSGNAIGVPICFASVRLALAPVLLLVLPVAGLLSARQRSRLGHCLRCGYDLRGSVSQVCTECGAAKNNQNPARPRAGSL
jgi:hypothetical protein